MSLSMLKEHLLQLEEYNYKFGDPRPILFHYLLKKYPKKVSSYLSDGNLDPHDMCTTGCRPSDPEDPESMERYVELPAKKNAVKALLNIVSKSDAPIVLLPFMVTRASCKRASRAKHLFLIVYNRLTGEMERIDFKRYHVGSIFAMKSVFKRLGSVLMPVIKEGAGIQKMEFVDEHDVPSAFINRYHDADLKSLYPIYMLSYIVERVNHPKKTAKEVHDSLVATKKIEAMIKLWDDWVKYNKGYKNSRSCGAHAVLNLQNNSCVQKSSKTLGTYLLEKPVKVCPEKKVFNMFTNRCTSPERLKELNVIVNDISNVARNTQFQHLGRVDTILKSLSFVMSKHPNGKLVMPPVSALAGVSNTRDNKEQLGMRWAYGDSHGGFKFTVLPNFWKYWNAAMKSSARFIIVLVSLRSRLKGNHANALIYDKTNNELERFDGLGYQIHDSYEIEGLDKEIESFFGGSPWMPEGFVYYTPMDYCPKFMMQYKELSESAEFADTRGNCAVWRLWYIDLRLSNPHLNRQQVVSYANKKVEAFGSFQKFIKAYQLYVNENM